MGKDMIPWVISFLMLVFAVLTYVRNGNRAKQKDEAEENNLKNGIKESLLKVNLKLDQLCSTTTETRSDIKSLNTDIQRIETRVSVLESEIDTLKRG